MVEADGSLRTWAIEQEPVAGQTIAAVALSDHRLAYLEYEGAVSGDRGSVTRWDQGLCRAVCWHDSRLELEMSGTRLQGTVSLARDSGADHWTFRFSPGNVATPV